MTTPSSSWCQGRWYDDPPQHPQVAAAVEACGLDDIAGNPETGLRIQNTAKGQRRARLRQDQCQVGVGEPDRPQG